MNPDDAPFALLVLFRIGGMVFSAPVFGGPEAPVSLRLAISVALAALFAPLVDKPAGAPLTAGTFAMGAAGELAVGLILGFAVSMLFAAARAAGRLVEQQMGLSFAGDVDPFWVGEESPVGRFKVMLATVVFFAIGGPHKLIAGTMESFRSVPLLGAPDGAAVGQSVAVRMAGDLFAISLQVVAPAVVALFLVTVGTGFVLRMVPELDFFAGGFGPRVIAGLALLALGVGAFASGFAQAAMGWNEGMLRLVWGMGGRP